MLLISPFDFTGKAAGVAETILAEFKNKITGATDEPVVGDNPENKFFVGKLLTKNSNDNDGYSSDIFIESVGTDFYVAKSEIENQEKLIVVTSIIL